MGFPVGYFWGNPYLPSVIVSYLDTNDFFFSGHVGMPLMTGLHYYHLGHKKMSILCFCTVLVEGFLVLITRVHYSIDIIIGLLFAHYVFINVNYYAKSIDGYLNEYNKRHMKYDEIEGKIAFLERINNR